MDDIKTTILSIGNESTEPKKELKLFSSGENETEHGTFIFDEQSANSVMKHSNKRKNKWSFDYNHASLRSDSIESNLSAGNYDLVVKEDGSLWATNIDYSTRAKEYIQNKEYLYISPAFKAKDNKIVRYVNTALCNDPATFGCDSLIKLSLKENIMTAEEPSVVETPIVKQEQELNTPTVEQKPVSFLSKIKEALSLPEASEEALLGTVMAMKLNSKEPVVDSELSNEVVSLSEKNKDLETQLVSLSKKYKDTLFELAKLSGKIKESDKQEALIKLSNEKIEVVEAFVNSLKPVVVLKQTAIKAPPIEDVGLITLTEAEKKICIKYKYDEKEFLATKIKLASK